MKREKILNNSLTIRINVDLIEKYKEFCEERGYSLSKRLRIFMENDIKGNIVIKKDDDKNINVI